MNTFNPLEVAKKYSRDFEPTEIMKYIQNHGNVPMSWGIENTLIIGKKILSFKVNGFKFQGIVFIHLNFDDTFVINLVKDMKSYEIVETIGGVYIEDLVPIIDSKVEKTENYLEDVSNWLENL